MQNHGLCASKRGILQHFQCDFCLNVHVTVITFTLTLLFPFKQVPAPQHKELQILRLTLSLSQFQALPSPPGNPGHLTKIFVQGAGIWPGQRIWPKYELTANANLIQWFTVITCFSLINISFSLRICRNSLGNITTEILKVVEKCKIY